MDCAGRVLRLRQGLVETAKAEVVSLTAVDVGPFGWMTLSFHGLFPSRT